MADVYEYATYQDFGTSKVLCLKIWDMEGKLKEWTF